MHLMVLRRNKKLDINNEKLSLKEFGEKLQEETNEVVEAIDENNLNHTVEEVLDDIQVCIGILNKLQCEGIDIKAAVQKHLKKLEKRGWTYKKMILFQVLNWH